MICKAVYPSLINYKTEFVVSAKSLTGELVKNPQEAVNRLIAHHDAATSALRDALARYFKDKEPPTADERTKFCYPCLIVETTGSKSQPATVRAFARIEGAGAYVTTITQPRFFAP